MNSTKIDRISSIPSRNDKDEESRRHLSSQKDTQFNNPKYTIIPKYLNQKVFLSLWWQTEAAKADLKRKEIGKVRPG